MTPIAIALHQQARFPIQEIPAGVVREIEAVLTWPNPEAQRRKMNKVAFDGPANVSACWKDERTLYIPSGAVGRVVRILDAHRLPWRVDDYTVDGPKTVLPLAVRLTPHQRKAADEVARKRYGTLKGRPGAGKVAIALALAAERALPTLVVVKTLRRLAVWETAICEAGASGVYGVVGKSRHEADADIVLATDRSLYRHIDAMRDRIGFVIVDRAELASRKLLQKGVGRLKKRYALGLMADRPRNKADRGMMAAYVGPVVHDLPILSPEARAAGRISVMIRPTGWASDLGGDEYAILVSRLIEDRDRNEQIVTDLLQETADPARRAVAVSDRVEHLYRLRDMLAPKFREGAVLASLTSKKDRETLLRRFADGKAQVLLATLGALDGLEAPREINAVVVASPFKGDIYAAAIMGRLLKDGGTVIDYRDKNDTLTRSLGRRVRMYREMGGVVK